MALQTILDYDWFKDRVDSEDLPLFESNFLSSQRTQEAILLWIDNECTKLDNETSMCKLRELPDRAEVTLMAAARRDVLNDLRKLLNNNGE